MVTHHDSGEPIDAADYPMVESEPKEPALRPFKNPDGSDAVCPFCGAVEALILADDELLHACDTCDRAWYIDETGDVLPADRCPSCESESVTVFEDGRRRCEGCGHAFFFDGLTYVDPATVESEESDGAEC